MTQFSSFAGSFNLNDDLVIQKAIQHQESATDQTLFESVEKLIDYKYRRSHDVVVWIDIETSGLSTDTCEILELAMCVTNLNGEPIPQLEKVGNFHSVVLPDERISRIAKDVSVLGGLYRIDRDWISIFSNNGLLLDHLSARDYFFDYTYEAVDRRACEWASKVKDHLNFTFGLDVGGINVHFDLGFLKLKMPRLYSMFHFTLLDISSLRKFFGTNLRAISTKSKLNHRAVFDLYATLEEYKEFVARFRNRSN